MSNGLVTMVSTDGVVMSWPCYRVFGSDLFWLFVKMCTCSSMSLQEGKTGALVPASDVLETVVIRTVGCHWCLHWPQRVLALAGR